MRAAPVAAMLALCLPLPARGQNPAPRAGDRERKECDVRIRGVERSGVPSHFQTYATAGGLYNTFYGGGFDARCEGTDQRILSDSAEHYGDQKMLVLLGRVHYTETRVKLDADRITYYTAEERLLAEGNVRGVTNTGTRFTAPRADYLRVAPGVRDKSRLTAELRPDVWVSSKDAGTDAKDSVHVQADRVISENDSLLYAKGRVVIQRPDLTATADSAFLDNGREFARLTIGPKITGRGERKFTLEGDVIEAYSKQRQVERVKSAAHARAVSEDVTLTADTIDLRVSNQKLERAFAWGPARARAQSKERDITADSIDVVMPGQAVREMRAVRRALAESPPDTAKIIAKEPDWLRGDTIVAYFDSVAARDTVNRPAIRQIVATGSARSFYQVAPGGMGKTATPNINYVVGRVITLEFKDRQVSEVKVTDRAAGFYLEALPDSARARAVKDSLAGKPAPKPPGQRPW